MSPTIDMFVTFHSLLASQQLKQKPKTVVLMIFVGHGAEAQPTHVYFRLHFRVGCKRLCCLDFRYVKLSKILKWKVYHFPLNDRVLH